MKTLTEEMKTKQYWKLKEDALVHLLVETAKGNVEKPPQDIGWYAGQLSLVRLIISNMELEE